MNIYEIIFSPTGGTQKAADVLASSFEKEIEIVDLSDMAYDFSTVEITAEDVCIIAAPAYGGRVPELAVNRLKQLKGNGAKAVLVAVYGNREFDDTLVELQDVSVECGFVPVAGVGAIAEHSLVRKFGSGRPDAEDVVELNGFAEKIKEVIQSGEAKALELPGNHPYKEFGGSPIKPTSDENCTKCKVCAWNCPAGAISEAEPNLTDADKCISCMRCVMICPSHARSISEEAVAGLAQRLEPLCAERKKNTLYL